MSELSLGHPENVSAEKRWLASYPPGVPSEIPASANTSLVELLEKSCAKFADRKAFSSMGKSLTYRELDIETRAVAAWLQSRGLEKGDRVAVMMPNILQNPVAVYGILRAGMIVVNVNPLYTPRELEHQSRIPAQKRFSYSRISPMWRSRRCRKPPSDMWSLRPWVISSASRDISSILWFAR